MTFATWNPLVTLISMFVSSYDQQPQAYGVKFWHEGKEKIARTHGEVILSAGAKDDAQIHGGPSDKHQVRQRARLEDGVVGFPKVLLIAEGDEDCLLEVETES